MRIQVDLVPKEGDCRKRQLRCNTSWGVHPHITPKPAEAKTIGLRCPGWKKRTDGSCTNERGEEILQLMSWAQTAKKEAEQTHGNKAIEKGELEKRVEVALAEAAMLHVPLHVRQ